MEYFVGSILTVIFIIIFQLIFKKYVKRKSVNSLRYSQSRTFQLLFSFIEIMANKSKPKRSQSVLHKRNFETRIAFMDNYAYWIKDNCFYMAPVIDDEINMDEKIQVDTMSMDAVQLKKMLYIVEQLREGLEDDSWNSGK